MDLVSIIDFNKQPQCIQDIFLKWWEPSVYDLAFKKDAPHDIVFISHVSVNKNIIYDVNSKVWISTDKLKPLLSEGQLRKFVEDKTGFKISVEPSLEDSYYLKYKSWTEDEPVFYGDNLLHLYWKLACKVISE